MPDDDARLLRRYAEEKSEAAFAELVQRHLDLVYSVALRQTHGDAALAQDVAQMVFTSLARKAAELAKRPVLGGWLFRTTQFVAIDAVRAESRRRVRETEAQTMHELTTNSGAEPDWEKLRLTLDEVIGELTDDDRDAVVLRFFEGKSFAIVGARLRLTENAARMRVERSLDKLHAQLARRGVTSTTAALSVALASHPAVAVPAGLAASVTGAALSGGGATAAGVGGWISTTMSTTKLQIGIVGALAAVGTTGLVVQSNAMSELRSELSGLRRQHEVTATLAEDNARLARAVSDAGAARTQAAELVRVRKESVALRGQLQTAIRGIRAEDVRKAGTPFTEAFFEPAQVDAQPKPTFQARPTYSAEMRKLGLTGRATIDFIVDGKGRVHNASIQDATHPAIGESALAAVRDWEFEPAQKGGEAVAMHMQIPIIFALANDEKPPRKADASGGTKPKPPAFAPWF